MNTLGEAALVQVVKGNAAVAALVSDRVTWDDAEIDIEFPAVTLRLLSTRMPVSDMGGRGSSRQALVEMSAHSMSSTGASQLLDAVVGSWDGYQTPFEIAVSGSTARFGSVLLNDVQQSPGLRERAYRKSAFFSVWQYE